MQQQRGAGIRWALAPAGEGEGASLDCSAFERALEEGRSSRTTAVAEGTPVRDGVPADELRHRDAQSRAGSLSGQRMDRAASALASWPERYA